MSQELYNRIIKLIIETLEVERIEVMNYSIKFCTVFIFCILFFTGCGQSYKNISHEDAARIMNSNQNALILDVRTVEEYEKKRVPGALLIPINEIKSGHLEKLPNKDQIILVYCWTGRRAEDAAKILSQNGYKYVYNFGGIVDWEGELEGSDVEEINN